MRLIDLMMTSALDLKLPPQTEKRTKDIVVAGLTADSRRVKPGYLFAALPGNTVDGHDYIGDAINSGAVAVLALPGTKLPHVAGGVELIEDSNPRRRFAKMAARFYGRQPENIAAVTGTNGKTSTVKFAQQLWLLEDNKAASLGTMGVDAPNIDWKEGKIGSTLTTPDSETLHREVADLSIAGVTHLAVEASSHGLDQYRVDGLEIRVGAFTNLSHDHLDYHGSMEAYFQAKTRLFSEVLPIGSTAVLNADSDHIDDLLAICDKFDHRTILFGKNGRDIRLNRQEATTTGQRLDITVFGVDYQIDVPIAGSFQAMNILCALGMVLALEKDPQGYEKHIHNISKLKGIKGRMECVARHKNGAPAYIDFAHTPDALRRVLEGLRPHTPDRLILVFGCGGDRDKTKRPLMGEIAAKLADKVIITDDNPRSENPRRIREEIAASCPGVTVIGDRQKAIEKAVSLMQPNDVLLVAGKGHETGQVIDKVVHPFDDALVIRNALKKAG